MDQWERCTIPKLNRIKNLKDKEGGKGQVELLLHGSVLKSGRSHLCSCVNKSETNISAKS